MIDLSHTTPTIALRQALAGALFDLLSGQPADSRLVTLAASCGVSEEAFDQLVRTVAQVAQTQVAVLLRPSLGEGAALTDQLVQEVLL